MKSYSSAFKPVKSVDITCHYFRIQWLYLWHTWIKNVTNHYPLDHNCLLAKCRAFFSLNLISVIT